MIFNQDPDINQMHMLKDCSAHSMGHELVPIVTMGESTSMLPEMLDHLPPPQMQILSSGQCMSNVLTGVYTLPEEPELEAEENTTM